MSKKTEPATSLWWQIVWWELEDQDGPKEILQVMRLNRRQVLETLAMLQVPPKSAEPCLTRPELRPEAGCDTLH